MRVPKKSEFLLYFIASFVVKDDEKKIAAKKVDRIFAIKSSIANFAEFIFAIDHGAFRGIYFRDLGKNRENIFP